MHPARLLLRIGALAAGTQLTLSAIGSRSHVLRKRCREITATDTSLDRRCPGIVAYGTATVTTGSASTHHPSAAPTRSGARLGALRGPSSSRTTAGTI